MKTSLRFLIGITCFSYLISCSKTEITVVEKPKYRKCFEYEVTFSNGGIYIAVSDIQTTDNGLIKVTYAQLDENKVVKGITSKLFDSRSISSTKSNPKCLDSWVQ